MGDCISPATLSDIASKDTNRIVGSVAKTLAANSPYINVLRGGVFASGVSDEVRSVLQMQAAPGDSLAVPEFVNDTEICGTTGSQELTGTVDLTYRLESKRGKGPRVCVKKGYPAFKSSYMSAEDSLAKLITQYINADIRAQLLLRSASKFNATAGYTFDDLFTGGTESDMGVNFAPLTPTGPLSFKALHAVARHLKEALFAEMFDANGKGMPHFRFIAGAEQIEWLRTEADTKDTLCCLTQGSFKLGEVALSAYSFESAPAYRGIALGTDQRPLRASSINGDGSLNLVNPVEIVEDLATNTAYAKASSAWLTAPLEVGMLIADGAFERQVPERYVGEGSFKFAPQLHMGELDWHYNLDNDCNVFGDFGFHKYQITRAYKPLRPQHVVPILYRRCVADLGLEDCAVSALPYTGSVL